MARKLKPGVSVATVTIFDPDTEEIDYAAMKRHVVRLAKAGLNSITVAGSNGEGAHLTREERKELVASVRKILDDEGFTHLPTIINCSGHSVYETVVLCNDAAKAGGDLALILPPSYYRAAYTNQSIVYYFEEVASKSPIPIILYNYPPVVAGIDLDSETITKLAQHPNIVGCKLTCGNVGKMNRIAMTVKTATPYNSPSGFQCMGGLADFTVQTLLSGGSGIITGLGNVLPKACVKVYDLFVAGDEEEAKKLQAVIALADWSLVAGGITSVKSVLNDYFHYGGNPRRPLLKATKDQGQQWAAALKEAVAIEKSL